MILANVRNGLHFRAAMKACPWRLCLPLTVVFFLCHSARGAEAPAPAFQAGLDVTLEATAGFRGGAHTGHSAEALALSHLAWQSPAGGNSPVAWHAYASVLTLTGEGPSGHFLGDFLAASNIEGYHSTRLYSWWLESEFALWSVRVGALLADEEFAGTDVGGHFANSAFGWPAFISANTVNTGPAFFVAAPGIRIARTLNANLTWRLGVYDGDTFDSTSGDPAINHDGLHYRLGGDQGWFIVSELAAKSSSGLTRWKAGTWWHTATCPDVYRDANGRPFDQSGLAPKNYSSNQGMYAAIEQTLAGKSGEPGHIDFYARLGGDLADRNTLAWALDTGVSCTGPLPNRPTDVFSLGLTHARFSADFAANSRLSTPGDPAPTYEQVIEATYSAEIGGHLHLQPGVQFIRHPGGSSLLRDALLCTFRACLSF